MKSVVITLCSIVLLALNTSAQSAKFTEAMTKALAEYKAAKTNEEFTAVAAKFERIGDAEKTQWLPYYYAGMVKVIMAFSAEDKDKVADEAQAFIDKAEALEKNNSEIYVIKSMIQTAKMLVDPMSRYMKNGAESAKFIEMAKKADATNPRPYYLQASGLKNTPEQFGGGCGTAKPLAEKAAALFASFKPASDIHPSWGKELNEAIVTACK